MPLPPAPSPVRQKGVCQNPCKICGGGPCGYEGEHVFGCYCRPCRTALRIGTISQAAYTAYELFLQTARLNLTPNLGKVIRVVDCCEAHELANSILEGVAVSGIGVLIRFGACWFDLEDVSDKFLRCQQVGSDIELFFDRCACFDGKCSGQLNQLAFLLSNGIRCHTVSGGSKREHYAAAGKKIVGGAGIHHAKWLLVGPLLLIGSANWTTSSKANAETMTLIEFKEAGLADWFRRVIQSAKAIGDVLFIDQVTDAQTKLEQRRLDRASSNRSEPDASPDDASPFVRNRSGSRTPSRSLGRSPSRVSSVSRTSSLSRAGSKRVSFRSGA